MKTYYLIIVPEKYYKICSGDKTSKNMLLVQRFYERNHCVGLLYTEFLYISNISFPTMQKILL